MTRKNIIISSNQNYEGIKYNIFVWYGSYNVSAVSGKLLVGLIHSFCSPCTQRRKCTLTHVYMQHSTGWVSRVLGGEGRTWRGLSLLTGTDAGLAAEFARRADVEVSSSTKGSCLFNPQHGTKQCWVLANFMFEMMRSLVACRPATLRYHCSESTMSYTNLRCDTKRKSAQVRRSCAGGSPHCRAPTITVFAGIRWTHGPEMSWHAHATR